MSDRPAHARSEKKPAVWWHRLIVQANLGPRAAPVKALLHAIADHVDENAIAFPGRKRLQQEAGQGGDALSAAIKRAEELGVLRVERSRGGARRPNRYWLCRKELEQRRHVWNSPESGQLQDEIVRTHGPNSPDSRLEQSGSAVSNYPETGQEPSHRSIPNKYPMKTDGRTKDLDLDGVDGKAPTSSTELRHALSKYGVKGTMLGRLADALAATGTGIEEIESEVSELNDDETVVNKPAVLVSRLADRVGIPTRRRERLAADNGIPMDPAMKNACARLQHLQRQRSVEGG